MVSGLNSKSRFSLLKRMTLDELKGWIALNMIPGVGSITFMRLVNFFGSPEDALKASIKDLLNVKGLTPAICYSIVDHRNKIDADRELRLIECYNLKVITIKDENYPTNLKSIPDPPPVLYIKGEILPRDSRSISIVGARKATDYGKRVANELSIELALRGFTIVSGMAHGIDSTAHNGAISASGRTLAVMGNGLDIVYPAENVELFKKIVDHGAVISEFPIGTRPKKERFPVRNRIISGLSLGTVVVEASKTSGSLITANLALEQGREVFAVPGPIYSVTSKGTNDLIKQGAKLVGSVEDILEELSNYTFEKITNYPLERPDPTELNLMDEEMKVLNAIGELPIHVDEIIRKSNLSMSKVSSALVMLELRGLINQLPGMMFTKKQSKNFN